MKNIKFHKAGKWAEPDTLLPQFEVEEGEEREVSNELADIIVDAKRGKIVPSKPAAVEQKPADKDKEKAEQKPAAKDKAAAESA